MKKETKKKIQLVDDLIWYGVAMYTIAFAPLWIAIFVLVLIAVRIVIRWKM